MKVNFTFEPEFDALYESYANDPVGIQLLKLDGISPDKLDVGKMSQNYFSKRLAEASIDQNANANEEMSANNYQAEVMKGILKLEGYYLIWRYSRKRFGILRANVMLKAIWDGEVYFHDASGHGIQVPYCYAFSTTPIMLEGRPYGQLQSLPPKRADSFVAQVIETTMDLSQEFVGAVAPSDFIVNYCYYAKREQLTDKQILNDLQKFVHVMNNKFRVSGQSPFVNLSLFDRANLGKIFADTLYPDGSSPDLDYIIRVEKLFGEWFSHGDPASSLPYRFPVATNNLSVSIEREIEDEDFLDWVANVNIEKGVFNIYINEGNKIATCCRLSNDFSQTKVRADSFGNGGLNLGSHRVVSLNLPRIGQEADGNRRKFFDILEQRMEIAKDLLIVHREEILKRRVEAGFLKFFKPLGWFDMSSLFSTFGVIGQYEMAYFMGTPMESVIGQEFVEDALKHIEHTAEEYSKAYGYNFNVEEIPGESTAVSLAAKDRLIGITAQPFELYSNQYVPLIAEMDAIDRVRLTGKFMRYLSGGGILHLNIAEKIDSPEKMKKLIRLAVKEGVDHLAINYGFGICENGHTSIVGTGKTCPICGGKIKDYLTRIIGYFTKTSSWNETRKNYEYPRRKFM